MQPISVRQLNIYVKSLLEGDRRLADVAIVGELSNFKNHYSSGHWYFTLKDGDAAVRCVMFRGSAYKVRFTPKDGMQVVLRGRASIYEKDGQYQFYAEEMIPAGDGGIALAIEQIKQKLAAEGLFDAANKRKLPKFPKKIAVITSETGAAVQDIMNILGRRYPICEVVLCPVAVQGESAVGEMIDALERVYRLSDIDLIIIGRGGGSIEDLWAFNSEQLARKIYEAPMPVISAVGHETDFTICDFVADLRAPTPSAAAELAVPDTAELLQVVYCIEFRLTTALNRRYEFEKARLDRLTSSRTMSRPQLLIQTAEQRLDRASERLNSAEQNKLNLHEKQFISVTSKLDAINPLKVMLRGFTVAEKNGEVIRSAKDIEKGNIVSVRFADGSAECCVEEVNYGN